MSQLQQAATRSLFYRLSSFVLLGLLWSGAAHAQSTVAGQPGAVACDHYVFKHITSATDTLAVQGVAGQTVYVCGFQASFAGTATFFLENTASVNANCSSSNTQITGVVTGAVNIFVADHINVGAAIKNTAGNGLCINSTGTGGVDVAIYYSQFTP